jgi:hypothetical protein
MHLFLPPSALWMTTSGDASVPLLGVTSLLPRERQSLAATLLVAYWAVTLRNSSVVYLKMSLCSPWHGFCMQHLGCVPTSPW